MGSSTSHTTSDGLLTREDIAKFELSICGRLAVYPQEPSQTITLNTGAGIDEWGDWTEIMPANTMPFKFTIVGCIIETMSATGVYHAQIGDCDAGLTPGANDIQGEIRFRNNAPVVRSTEMIPFGCRGIEGSRRVMGRLKNDSGDDNITISIITRRYIEVSAEVPKWPTYPW